MNRYSSALLTMTLVFLGSTLFGLAPEYQRNGECYILVGHDDASYRGVYRLNNPAAEADGTPLGRLYDPGNSDAITVDLNRNVMTVSTYTNPILDSSNFILKRQLKTPGDCTLFGAHCDTRKSYPATEGTVNEWAKPIYTTTGPAGTTTAGGANVTDRTSIGQNVAWEQWGTGRVTIQNQSITDPVMGYPGWYLQKTLVTCDGSCIYTNGYSDNYHMYFVPVDGLGYGSIPNNSWWQSRDPDPAGRPGNIFYWDRATRQYTQYQLKKWNKPMGVLPGFVAGPVNSGIADTIYDEFVNRHRISACMNCVCVNGAAPTTFQAEPKWVSMAISPFNRIYLYTRTQASTTDGQVRLNATPMSPVDPNLRGYVNDPTSKWVGISTAGTTSDFVYVLGTRIIKEWLAPEYNITVPPTFSIEAVTVSDQWWLDGGIVYAYDRDSGSAYQFIRFDKASNTCKVPPISMNLGTDVDDIKADGFGNAFFSKTKYDPTNTTGFNWTHNYAFNFYYSYLGRSYGRVYYRQDLNTYVYKRPVGSSVNQNVGFAKVGENLYYRVFSVPDAVWPTLSMGNLSAQSGLPSWIWGAGYTSVYTVKPNLIQLGIINVATPPNVDKIDGDAGHVDIYCKQAGPTYDFSTNQINQGLYDFVLENPPKWNGKSNIVGPGKSDWQGDSNNNGFNGGFVSSLMNSSNDQYTSPELLFKWKVLRIQDQFGTPIPPEVVKDLTDVITPSLMCYMRSGTYQIMCSAKFRWYNYDALTFGSTVASLSDCLRPVGGGYEDAKAPPVASYVLNTLGYVPVPANTAVLMVTVNQLDFPPTGTTVEIQKRVGGIWVNPVATFTSGGVNYTIASYHTAIQDATYTWRINPASLTDLFTLPVWNDQNMQGLPYWKNDAQFDWAFKVRLPDNTLLNTFSKSVTTTSPANTWTDFGLSFPTDPATGTLVCDITRRWSYRQNQYDADGNFINTIEVTPPFEVKYHAEVSLLVLDTQPPQVVSVNGLSLPLSNNQPLYLGTTMDDISQVLAYSGYTNPSSFTISIQDNNPFGNATFTTPIPESQHNRNKQYGTLYFEQGLGKAKFPDDSDTLNVRYYSASNTDVLRNGMGNPVWVLPPPPATAHVMRYPVPYKTNTTFSEVQYVFNVGDWKDAGSPGSRNLPTNFATNAPGYQSGGALNTNSHKGLALAFLVRDASGNVPPLPALLGNLWIKDTLLPVPVLQVQEYASKMNLQNAASAVNETEPFGVQGIWSDYTKFNNNPEWHPLSDGHYPDFSFTTVYGVPQSLAAELTGTAASPYRPAKIMEGNEVFLNVMASDNIATHATLIPRIVIKGPLGLGVEGSPSQMNLNSDATPLSLRVLLEKSGVYNLTISAWDNALDFDCTTQINNKRDVNFGIIVAPTKMEIRVLDKKNEKF